MKAIALISLLSLAALSACSSKPHSRKEGGPAQKPYLEFLPTIADVATNKDGGIVLGRKPREVDVSPTIAPQTEGSLALDLKNYTIAGVGLNNTIEEIVAILGTPRIVSIAADTYYVFDAKGLLAGIDAAAASPLKSKPTFIATMENFAGSLKGPTAWGEIRFGKQVKDGALNNWLAIENFAKDLSKYAEGSAAEDYDCFAEGKCTTAPLESGSRAIVLPHALIELSSAGVLTSVELDQEVRELGPSAPPSRQVQYGASFGGLSLNAKPKDFATNYGEAVVLGNVRSYADDTIMTLWSSKEELVSLVAQGDTTILFAADATESPIQLNSPAEGTFDCASLITQSIAAFDPTAPAKAVTCKAGGANTLDVSMPAAVLSYSSEKDPDTAAVVPVLSAFYFKLRPIVYGQSIAGIEKGFDKAHVEALYGPLPDDQAILAKNGVVAVMDGLNVTFQKVGAALVVTSVQARVNYPAPVLDAQGNPIAQLGKANPGLSFSSDLAASESFKFFAQSVESDYLAWLRAQSAPGAAPLPSFDAATECSMVPEKTNNCFLQKIKDATGAPVYALVLPHMQFFYDASEALTLVGL